MRPNPRLNVPQGQFITMPHKFRAFVAGFGSGKSWAGCAANCMHMLNHPRIESGYFAPSFPHIRDIYYPTIDEVAADWGMTVRVKTSDHEVDFYGGGRYRGTTICRSMDRPETIVGFKIGHAHIDELDVMPTAKAQTAWRKIIARMRYKVAGLRNGVDVTTTPEGFRFTYQRFVQEVQKTPSLRASYGILHASTHQNAKNLPDDYISTLMDDYPPQLIEAYLHGRFVNLTSGSVYPEFSRTANHTDETMQPGEPLHVGMDFNVQRMAAVISVIRDGEPRTVAELTKIRDTPAMIAALKDRFYGHHITVYPDASGKARKTVNSTETDQKLLREAGFTVLVNHSNPAVRDRVAAVNAMILNANGQRRWRINTDLCPVTTQLLEQQAYDTNGDPTKDGTEDPIDAVGYFLAHRYPIIRNTPSRVKIVGV